ncbi:hypothetical protein ABID42_002075 [Arcicella rosea]|uniref:hypothetical protein n=1 Tax=Arcicella rosea TaxID=502909 RepID=UPI00345D37C8
MKKLFENPLITAFIGLFVGGLLTYGYQKYLFSKNKEEFQGNSQFLPYYPYKSPDQDTPIQESMDMITALYDYMQKKPDSTAFLFRRSYALDLYDFNKILKKYSLIDTVNKPNYRKGSLLVRIYPGLRMYQGKNILSMIVTIEKDRKLLIDKTVPYNSPQLEVQDQLGPCPINCPGGGGDLFTEAEWRNLTGRYYIPYP